MSKNIDLSNSIVLPREDFIELTETAYGQTPTATERVATTLQTTAIVMGIAGAVSAAGWALNKAADWRDERKFKRAMALKQKDESPDKDSTKK